MDWLHPVFQKYTLLVAAVVVTVTSGVAGQALRVEDLVTRE